MTPDAESGKARQRRLEPRLWRWLQRTDLSVRLAIFSAGIAALVIFGSFAALNVQVRKSTRDLFSLEIARNGKTLVALQKENQRQLVLTAALLAESPTLRAAISTYRVEQLASDSSRNDLTAGVENELRRLGTDLPGDLLLATNDSGKVFAAYARSSGVQLRGMDISSLPAVRNALDPAVVATNDEPYLAGLEATNSYFGVGVAPLVVNGYAIGTIVYGQRVDSTSVASLRRDFVGDVVVSAGPVIVSSTLPDSLARVASGLPGETGRVIHLGDAEYLVADVPIGRTQRNTALRITLLQPLTPSVNSLTQALRRDFLIYGTIAVLLTGLGAAILSRSLLNPLVAFIRFMRRGADREQVEEEFDASDASQEIRVLNKSFNQLMQALSAKREELERRGSELAAANEVLTEEITQRERVERALRESEEQLRQSQKLEAIGTLAGGIAHDFNNMLTVISGFTQLAMASLGKGHPVNEDLKQVTDASTSAAALTHQLLAFSRKQVMQARVLDLETVIHGMEGMLRRLLGARIELVIEHEGEAARTKADPSQIEQVLLNLAVNAHDAMPDGGVLIVTTGHRRRSTGADSVLLQVHDTGSGMPPEVRERIFEPFFTTKEVGKGTGLGLSTVYGIVTQSGGTISVDSKAGEGTTFTVLLPAMGESTVIPVLSERDISLPTGMETILLVDDQDAVLDLARRTLEECGYTVYVAHGAVEALTMVTASKKIDALVTDVVMPQMSGPQLADRYLAKYPNTAVVYMTGFVDDETLRLELDSDVPLLRKPFAPSELAQVVRSVLDSRRAALFGGRAAKVL